MSETFVAMILICGFVPLATAYAVHVLIQDYHKKCIQPLFALQKYQESAVKPQDIPPIPKAPLKVTYGKVGLGLSEEQLSKLQFELQELS